ncbi:MAG: glycosyltransferase family 2 protein [Lachnospiraceae bacterium]|nr:glycosyltransferase family 2 protein [Lachnospiraceae bacterium]
MTEEEQIAFYQKLYEEEKEKSRKLSARLANATREAEDLQRKLDNIKGSAAWKISAPLRSVYHWTKRTKERVGNYGSVKGFARKLDSKRIEKLACLQHGTRSFPDEAERKRQQETKFSRNIKISILTPLYNTPEKFLREMIESVQAQTYGNWELCLADGSDAEHKNVGEICMEYAAKDSRVRYSKLEKNGGISANTNECLKLATGEYIGLFDHDDLLHPSVLYEYMKRICDEDADYLYCDECTFQGSKGIDAMITLHFKPDFAIDNLRANNYICHFSVFDRRLLEGMELFRSQFDGSQDHDMILRLTAKAKHVVHVPKLMYYWRSHKGSTAADINSKSYAIEAARGAVADHLTNCGFRNFEITSTKAFETIFRIQYEVIGNPKISILIPNKDHVEDLQRCVGSILQKSTYDNYEIIILENNSVTREIEDYYAKLLESKEAKVGKIRIVRYEGDFNYSAINNLGAKQASGEYLVLLNNDTEVITINWMEELLMYAQREDVGAVGAKLYYADHTIQHAGVVIGLGAHRTAGHSHYKVAQTNLGYMGRLCYAQDVSAVTGACLMVKKSLYDELGGLDESFAVSLNDVDFCLRLLEKGLWNVFTPFAELFHYESVSRGLDDNGEKAERYNRESASFREKWKTFLEKGDPFYNPNFSLDRSDFSLKLENQLENRET